MGLEKKAKWKRAQALCGAPYSHTVQGITYIIHQLMAIYEYGPCDAHCMGPHVAIYCERNGMHDAPYRAVYYKYHWEPTFKKKLHQYVCGVGVKRVRCKTSPCSWHNHVFMLFTLDYTAIAPQSTPPWFQLDPNLYCYHPQMPHPMCTSPIHISGKAREATNALKV